MNIKIESTKCADLVLNIQRASSGNLMYTLISYDLDHAFYNMPELSFEEWYPFDCEDILEPDRLEGLCHNLASETWEETRRALGIIRKEQFV